MTEQMLKSARAALHAAPPVGDDAYARYCQELSRHLIASWPDVLAANERDGTGHLTESHLAQLVDLTVQVELELPGLRPDKSTRDWGSLVRVPRPLGVVLMVCTNPTVTVDGALLPVVVGNAVLLHGGKEMAATSAVLADVIRTALISAGLPSGLVTVVDDPDRSRLRTLLKRPDAIDVLIPQGSPALVEYCRNNSSIPVIAGGRGVNHLYVHRSANLDLAAEITVDGPVFVLVDKEIASDYVAALRTRAKALTIRLDPDVRVMPDEGLETLKRHDIGREFPEAIIGVLAVDGPAAAIEHIRQHGSAHTEGIVTTDKQVASEFARKVDAAAIVINSSLRLHDGPRLGLGAGLAIATGRLHVRGPVTLGALVTSTWVADGSPTD